METPIDPKLAREALDCIAHNRAVDEFKIRILRLFIISCSLVAIVLIVCLIYLLINWGIKLHG